MTVLKLLQRFQTPYQTTYLTNISQGKLRGSSESFEEKGSQTHTSKWLQVLPRNRTPSYADDPRPWPNSQRTTEEDDNLEGSGCSNTMSALKATSMASDTTANIMQEFTYVGGMNYARTRLLEATGPRNCGKGRKVRPSTLLAQTALSGPHGTSRFASTVIQATSGRPSAYSSTVAAVARKSLLEAQLEAELELLLACPRTRQSVIVNIKLLQKELRSSIDRHAQGQDMQAAEMNAMGHHIIEMKDLLIQRELRKESQLQEMCSQIHTIGAVLKIIQPQTENIIPTNLIQDANHPPPKPSTKNVTLKREKN